MGIASSVSELSKNEYLQRYAGPDHVSTNDPLWNQLLSFQFKVPQTSDENRALEENIESLCRLMIRNQPNSRNFTSLVCVFLARAAEIKASTQTDNNVFIWQATNALFILRTSLRHFVENADDVDAVARQFDVDRRFRGEIDASSTTDNLLDPFFGSLMEIIVDVPLNSATYALHLEAVNTILVALSVQMFTTAQAEHRAVFQTLMYGNCSIHSGVMVKQLLANFADRMKAPAGLYHSGGGSIILGLASGLWSALTFGYGSGDSGAPSSSAKGRGGKGGCEDDKESNAMWKNTPLALQSVHLLLVLATHCTRERQGVPNPYRQALFSFTNSAARDTNPAVTPRSVAVTFTFDYGKLFEVFSSIEHCDQTTVLLYVLLHKNPQFRIFVLSRSNIESIVLPILRTLYDAPRRNPQHIYMSLIILLILTEDDIFNSTVHDVMLANVPWYQERNIWKISLGGLVILVIIRTIQFNLTRTRDRYLHTNCLAALANMSGSFKDLHPYVSQRILSLFAFLAKRYDRVADQVRASTNAAANEAGAVANGESDSHDQAKDANGGDLVVGPVNEAVQDMHVLEEVLRMVLEIINSCLTHQLPHNLNLVYAILYQKEIFYRFRTHPTFLDISHNIDIIIAYFKDRVDAAGHDLSVEDVQAVIREASVRWPKDMLKKFPDLRFKYVEEEDPEEFFVPYVWSVIAVSAHIWWNVEKIQLFNWVEAGAVDDAGEEPNELVVDQLNCTQHRGSNGVLVL